MKRYLFSAIALVALVSCSKTDGVESTYDDYELKISSSIATRASDTSWAADDEIGVSMYATGTITNGDENRLYTTTTTAGDFSSTNPLYYPTTGGVDLLAYYPYVESVDLTAYALNMGGEQKEADVDLMKATLTVPQSSSTAVEMTFYHKLSKLKITITDSATVSASELNGGTMTLSGSVTGGTYNLHTDVLTPSTTKDDIEVTITDGVANMILIPQTLSDAKLTFETSTGGKFTATLSGELKAGCQTNYNATMALTEATLSSASIGDWGDGDEVNKDLEASGVSVDIALIDETYYISTGLGLQAFAALVNGDSTMPTGLSYSGEIKFSNTAQPEIDGELTRNIFLSDICGASIGDAEVDWTPIGNSTNNYKGSFDGKGYVVSGLYINSEDNNQGLFGYVKGTSNEIKNITVTGSVTGVGNVGGVIGYTTNTYVTNCCNMAEVSGNKSVGGVIGNITNGSSQMVSNCYNTAKITATASTDANAYAYGNYAGGVVGYAECKIINCYNTGKVSGVSYVGGIVGDADDGSNVTNCYNTATIIGTGSYVGGIAGKFEDAEGSNCYSAAEVSGDSNVGGVVGELDYSSSISNYYWDSGFYTSGNGVGSGSGSTDVVGYATDIMKNSEYITSQSYYLYQLLNDNAATYNNGDPTPDVKACAWIVGSNGYPELDFDNDPTAFED